MRFDKGYGMLHKEFWKISEELPTGGDMEQGKICIYSGDGHGKSPAALGKALQAASQDRQVVIIQFMKGKGLEESEFLKRLEPEIKFFRFEKSEEDFLQLPIERQKEEIQNIKNGLNYAKKVLYTGECDLLILDEVLGLLDNDIITPEDLKTLLSARAQETTVIMTGIQLKDEICALADEVSRIETLKFKVF